MIHTTVIKSLSRGVLQFQRFHVKLLHFTHMSILCKIFGNSGSNSGNNETNVVRVRGIPRPNEPYPCCSQRSNLARLAG